MAYEHRPMGRQRVRYDDGNDDLPLTYQLVLPASGKVTPTSGTITIYRDGATDALVSAAAMTVSGTLLRYTLDTTTEATWPTGQYRADVVVTYSSVTYPRHFRFDVVPYVFDMAIGVDQLVAIDHRIRGMLHDGDPDFKSLIAASAGVLQARLESKLVNGGRLLQDHAIDWSSLATAQCFYVISEAHRENGDDDRADKRMAQALDLMDAVLSTMRFDTGLSGEEPAAIGGITEIVFQP